MWPHGADAGGTERHLAKRRLGRHNEHDDFKPRARMFWSRFDRAAAVLAFSVILQHHHDRGWQIPRRNKPACVQPAPLSSRQPVCQDIAGRVSIVQRRTIAVMREKKKVATLVVSLLFLKCCNRAVAAVSRSHCCRRADIVSWRWMATPQATPGKTYNGSAIVLSAVLIFRMIAGSIDSTIHVIINAGQRVVS